jgi:predicted DNA-binding protein
MLLVFDSQIEEQLEIEAKEHNETKEGFIKNLVLEYLEDKQDVANALKALKRIENGGKTYTWEEVKERYGL